MDNVVVKLLDLFKHISRDIMIYVISGFVVIVNLYVIDKVYIKSEFFQLIDKLEYLPLIIFILSYIIGHIIMALSNVFYKVFYCKSKKDVLKKEMKIFKKDSIAYEYFIERQNQLYHFRLTLSGAFFISAIINILYKCIGEFEISLFLIFIPITISIFLFLAYYISKARYKEKIKKFNLQKK